MNEMKPGERPDTIHVQNLPTKWFINQHDKSGVAKDKPSEYVVRKVFAMFGDIRAIDIPMLDPYRYIKMVIEFFVCSLLMITFLHSLKFCLNIKGGSCCTRGEKH